MACQSYLFDEGTQFSQFERHLWDQADVGHPCIKDNGRQLCKQLSKAVGREALRPKISDAAWSRSPDAMDAFMAMNPEWRPMSLTRPRPLRALVASTW